MPFTSPSSRGFGAIALKPPRAIAGIAMFGVLLPLFSASGAAAQSGEVNLYTHREPQLIKPLLDRFTAETGIKVNVVFARAGLAERIQSEGERSPADMLLSVDVATLAHAVNLGISQPIKTPILEAAIPAQLRAADGSWNGVSMRARVVYAAKDRVKADELTYESLADPKFRGKICTRSFQHDYNIGLTGAVVAHLGEAKAEEWLKGVRANLAKKPSGGDRDVAKDIAAGTCDLGLGNTYYVGLMQNDPNQKAWADAIRVILPHFSGGGTHVNVSGFIITKSAKHRDAAIKLGEFMVSKAAQKFYADENFEYPIVAGVPAAAFTEAFGPLKIDQVPLDTIAKNRKIASELVDKTGFDIGPGE